MITMKKKKKEDLGAKIYNVEREKGQNRITNHWKVGLGIFVYTVPAGI